MPHKTPLLTAALLCLATSVQAGEAPRGPAGPSATAGAGATATAASASRSASRSGASANASNSVTVNNAASSGRSGGSGNGAGGPRNAPDVLAPALSGGGCPAGFSLGGSGLAGGGVLGGLWESKGCGRRLTGDLLWRMDLKEAAQEILCNDDETRRARYSTGFPCARDRNGWDTKVSWWPF